ncbi:MULTISPECIES: hypothetical protein [unclassified Methanoregula]|uniref:hypothetical protein n=1 Tax=unclassified Methanoregula TaxID=2649730 RepID=UPI0009CD0767|nr:MULTISPECIES: hypothetical protein [unclassified Methanoregula]OPX64297.1 MAG: hypothetical protein A4E33_01326 [Methanoregula sp. PtaB.Bin085]OPY33578.1 MAG: hypothetical protein A4E34_01901 [Methanoregula sp. PtaU1.Bin006]
MTTKPGAWIRDRLGWCPNNSMVRFGRPATRDPDFPVRTAGSLPGRTGSSGEPGAPSQRTYEHTQTGMLQIIAVLAIIVIILVMTLLFGPLLIPLAVLFLLVVTVLCFATLTVTIEDDAVRIRFGPLGLVRREWPVRDIVAVSEVTNPWYYGYGIRWTPHGPLYNVSGSHAIEILLLSGKKVRIGTDEPEALVRAISHGIR